MEKFKSGISNLEFPVSERVSAKIIRQSILELIQKDYPEFTSDKSIAVSELNTYREKYIENFLNSQVGNLSALENTVLNSLKTNSTLTDKIDVEEENQTMTFGQRIADKVAVFGGSGPLLFLLDYFFWYGFL